MAVYTLVNSGSNTTPGGADLFASSISATYPSGPPADFNPAAITRVTYSFEAVAQSLGDDGMGVQVGCTLSVGGQQLVQLTEDRINIEPASGAYPFSRTITTGINQSISVQGINWNSVVVEPNPYPFITYLANMKSEGGSLTLRLMTVEVEYTPAGPVVPSSSGSLSLDVALAGAGVIPPIVRSSGGDITLDVALAGAGGVPVPTADGNGSLSLDVALAGAGELITPSKTGSGSITADMALAGAGEVISPSLSGSGDLTADVSLSGSGQIAGPSASGSGNLTLDVALAGSGELITPVKSSSGSLATDVVLSGVGYRIEFGGAAKVWRLTALTAEGGTLDGTEVVAQQPAGMDLQWDGTKWAWG